VSPIARFPPPTPAIDNPVSWVYLDPSCSWSLPCNKVLFFSSWVPQHLARLSFDYGLHAIQMAFPFFFRAGRFRSPPLEPGNLFYLTRRLVKTELPAPEVLTRASFQLFYFAREFPSEVLLWSFPEMMHQILRRFLTFCTIGNRMAPAIPRLRSFTKSSTRSLPSDKSER